MGLVQWWECRAVCGQGGTGRTQDLAVGEQTVSAQRRAHAVPTFGLQHGRGMAQSTEREQRMREDGSTDGVRPVGGTCCCRRYADSCHRRSEERCALTGASLGDIRLLMLARGTATWICAPHCEVLGGAGEPAAQRMLASRCVCVVVVRCAHSGEQPLA